jgi:uncharacterized repeat protein (TIGR01451 family)
VTGAILTDVPSSGLTLQSVTCGSATGGATCPANVTVAALTGAGISVDLPVTVTPPAAPVPSGLVFTVVAKIDPAQTASVINTASITPPNGPPVSSTDTDTVTQSGDISVTKVASSAQVTKGAPVTFHITARNNGPSNLSGVVLSDVLPSGMTGTAVVCTGATGGAVCPDPATVTVGALTGTGLLIDLPTGSSLSFDLTVALASLGDYSNTATVTHPSDSTPNDNQSTAVVRVVAVAPPTPTPALDFKALVLLSFMLLASGAFLARSKRMRG